MANKSKNFWFKCNHDFFENHKMRCLERSLDFEPKKLAPYEVQNIFSMAMGYVYIKLLAESCTHDGELRLSEKKAYTNRTLAKVIGCPLPFFNYVMECLTEFEMVQIDENGTITLPEIKKLVGSESESAERMRRLRDRGKNSANPPQEASEEVGTSDDTASEGTPEKPVSARLAPIDYSKADPPSLETVMKIATTGFQMTGGKPIPKEIVEEWYSLMVATGWIDTKGQDCARMWRNKLGYYWIEETKKKRGEAAKKEESERLIKEAEEAAFRHNKSLLAESYDD